MSNEAGELLSRTPAPPSHRLSAGRGVSTFCGHVEPAQWLEHHHDRLEIVVLFEAAVCDFTWQSAGGQKHEQRLEANQLCLIGSGQKHSGFWRQPASLAMLHVEQEFLQETVGREMDGIAVHEFSRIARSDLVIWETTALLRRLSRAAHREDDLYLESLGTIFATHVLQAHFGAAPVEARPCGLSPKQLRCVTDYMAAHLKQTIRVGDLAREASLSAYHFIRRFKQTTGLSPYRYLIQCRVERAHELLRSGNCRVAEAAYEAGFCDQSHLDRYFRRHFGFPPKTVLKQPR